MHRKTNFKINPYIWPIAAVILAACYGGTVQQPLTPPTAIEILPRTPPTLLKGGGIQLAVRFTGGNDSTLTWRSSNTNILNVDAIGLVTARDTGTAWIVATSLHAANIRDSVSIE